MPQHALRQEEITSLLQALAFYDMKAGSFCRKKTLGPWPARITSVRRNSRGSRLLQQLVDFSWSCERLGAREISGAPGPRAQAESEFSAVAGSHRRARARVGHRLRSACSRPARSDLHESSSCDARRCQPKCAGGGMSAGCVST